MKRIIILLLLSVPALSQTPSELIYGITTSGSFGTNPGIDLVKFYGNAPTAITTIGPLTGVIEGQGVRSIDFRPATGQLYAISTNTGAPLVGQLYTVNIATAVLTPVGTGFALGSNGCNYVEMEFDPITDKIRIIIGATGTGFNNNFRANPHYGNLEAIDADLAFAPGDPNAGNTTRIAASAYSNNGTLYGWSYPSDMRVTIGGVGGVPSPNDGLMFTVFNPGSHITFLSGIGMDISVATGILYVTRDEAGHAERMRIDAIPMASGFDYFTGIYPNGVFINDISVAPSISGMVTCNGNPVPGVLLASTSTDASGNYILSEFTGTVTPSKTGGQNGAITSFDAAMIAQYATGVITLTETQRRVADVSGNGQITSFDAAMAAAYSASLPGTGATGNWIFSPANRTYPQVMNIVGENYTALLMGDVSGNWGKK